MEKFPVLLTSEPSFRDKELLYPPNYLIKTIGGGVTLTETEIGLFSL